MNTKKKTPARTAMALVGLAAAALVGTSSAEIATLPKKGGVAILSCGKAKRSGDELISITYLDPKGELVPFEAATGQSGSQHEWDDIAKGTSGPAKAAAIATAINDSGAPLTASAVGHVVTVGTTGGCQGIRRMSVTNNTRQARDKVKISVERSPGPIGAQPLPEGYVTLVGILSRQDDDGNPAEFALGTDRGTFETTTGEHASLVTLCQAAVGELVAHGVSASLVRPTVIRVVLDPVRDGQLVWGCTDTGATMMAGVELPD